LNALATLILLGSFLAAVAHGRQAQAQLPTSTEDVQSGLVQTELVDLTCGSGIERNVFIGCQGDCNQDSGVTIDEIIRLVDIILGSGSLPSCPALLGTPSISEIIQAVNSALYGCPPVAHYHLIPDSKIVYYPPAPAPLVEEPLSGALALVGDGFELQFAFVARVTQLEFQSSDFTLTAATTGAAGCAQISDDPDHALFVTLMLIVNGAPVNVFGTVNSAGCCSAPETIEGLQICGGSGSHSTCDDLPLQIDTGYSLTIFAIRDE
jgi:hypothetical protein